jgi:CHAT domain-containing protein
LIEPVQAEMEGLDSLVIVPHGPLHTLPFQALRLGGRYLIEQFSLSVDPSAAVFKYCQEKPAQRQGRQPFSGKALLAGVPDEQAACVTEEIEGLAKIFDETQVLLGEQARLNNFRQTASSSGLIHLAAHGIFRPEAPLLSSIHLFDGWLAVQDIYNLDLHAELVTLSACETGLGYDAGGDDLVGLVRGFLHAGARSLVVSLWMVEDESMARLMKSFYSFWLAGDSKAKALQKSQLDLLKIYGHPFYWAPLNLVGAES